MRIFGGGDIKEVEECCSWDNTREMANKITVFITRVQVEPTKQWRITFVVVFKWGIIRNIIYITTRLLRYTLL